MANLFGLISFTIVDELGIEASLPIYTQMPDTMTLAQAISVAEAVETDLDAVTAGQILKCQLKFTVPPASGIKTAPAVGSRVEQTALLNFNTTVTTKRNGFSVPAIANSLISGGKIIVASGAVKALADLLITGSGSALFTNALDQVLNAWVDAVLSFRKHRKQLARESVEQTTGD